MEIVRSTLITGNNLKSCKCEWCKSHVIFLPVHIQQVFFAYWFAIRGSAPTEGGNTENLTFQAVRIMYSWMSTPHFVRVGSLHGLIFVIYITKSVKQSVQNAVVSEFTICFSEWDRIFGLMQRSVIFWKWPVFSGLEGNGFTRCVIPDLLGWRRFLFIPKACYSRLFHRIYIWTFPSLLASFTGVLLARCKCVGAPMHRWSQ